VLGVRLPTVKEGLERFRRMQDDGWPRRLRGALAADGTTPAPAGREERHR